MVTVQLFDRVGNRAAWSWPVDWGSAQAPRLLSLADRLTNQSDYTLVLEWNEPPGTVKVTVNEATRAFTAAKEANSRWQLKVPVAFDGREDTKSARVRVEPPGGAPSGEDEILLVRYLSRDLAVKEGVGERTEDNLPALYATSENNKTLNEDLHWEYLVIWEGGGGAHGFSNKKLRGPVLRLDARRDMDDRRGKFVVLAEVSDDFGNRSSSFQIAFAHGVQEPTIQRFGLEDQRQRVIHHRDCRLSQGLQGRITFAYEVAYEYGMKSLNPELWLGELPPLGTPVVIARTEEQPDRLEVPLARLREVLKEGPNSLFLVVTDPKTGKKGVKTCTLTYEVAPSLKVTPQAGRPLGSDEVRVVVTPGGSAVSTVTVTASGQRVPRLGPDLVHRVPLNAAGRTRVFVEVEFRNGCRLTKEVSYCREPIEEQTYVYELGAERRKLELTHARGLWYTRMQAPATLAQARNQEALRAALQSLLQSLPGRAGVWKLRLASFKELQEISPNLPPGNVHKQWVRSEGRESGAEPFQGFHPCAEWNGRGVLEGRELVREKLPYHLVLEGPEEASRLLPSLAVDSHKKQGGKP